MKAPPSAGKLVQVTICLGFGRSLVEKVARGLLTNHKTKVKQNQSKRELVLVSPFPTWSKRLDYGTKYCS